MRKINWLKRLFMSWSSLEDYFNRNINTQAQAESINYLKEIHKKSEERLEILVASKDNKIKRLSLEVENYKTKSMSLNAKLEASDGKITDKNDRITKLSQEIEIVKSELASKKEENRVIQAEIRDQLKTIGKIESTFFGKSGNKGKGELGERQVKTILEKSGLPSDMWVENLLVNSKSVEFAMQSGEEGKYIPIDSKVLETEISDNHIVIDDKYKKKVEVQVKEVTKYLGKSNTADYGIIVLQSDDIYMKLFNEFPTFFQDMIETHRVYINSPSSFVQTAWSISNLIKLYTRVKNDEKIYGDMLDALTSVGKFAVSLGKVHKDFNIAMGTHYPTIQKRHTELVKRLNKTGKLKDLKEIDVQ